MPQKTPRPGNGDQHRPNSPWNSHDILMNAPVGIFTSRPDGGFISVNPSLARMYGYETPEAVIENITDIGRQVYVDPVDRDEIRERLSRHGEVTNFECRWYRRDGATFWVSVNARAVGDGNADTACYQGFVTDITERKQMEALLSQNENRFRLMFMNAPMAYQSLDENGRFLDVNQAYTEALGYDREELIGRHFGDFLHPDWTDHFKENFPKFKAVGEILGVEFEMVKKDGSGILVYFNGRIQRDGQGRFQQTHCILQDITESRKAEEALKRSESIQRKMVANIGDVIVIIDSEGINRYKSPNIEKLFGWKPEEVIGASTWENVHPDDLESTQNVFMDLIQEPNAVRTTECRYRCRDGSYRWIEFTGSNLLHDPEIRGILGNYHDITGRKQTENTLQASELRYRLLFEQAPVGIFHFDRSGTIVECNDNFINIVGSSREKLIGLNMLALRDKKLVRELHKAIEGSTGFYEDVYQSVTADKSTPVKVYVAPLLDKQGHSFGCVGIVEDITERRQAEAEREKLQAQLVQAQKLESVGKLAGGVAHDYNNILAVISGYSEIALEKTAPGDPIQEDLKEIQVAARCATDITRQLLAFARKQTINPRVLNLNEIVADMLKMIRRLIGEDIDLSWEPGEHLGSVRIDPAQVDQILANLCVNARDAIAGVGNLTIETANVRIDEDYCIHNTEADPGEYVMLAVSDDGHGMDPATRASIFDPFFTTKAVGEGTGLGLATVYGIIKQNNGFIDVDSEPGKGAVFRIYLPRHADQMEAVGNKEVAAAGGTGETVLVVEDEPSILTLVGKMLESLGYKVLAGNSPGEALELAAKHDGRIHLLLTDVVMPEMSGRDLVNQLRLQHPDIKTLYMSGYTADIITRRGVLDAGLNFLQKPFSKQDLATKIQTVLAEGA